MIKELRAGIYSLLTSAGAFHTSQPNVYWKAAPQGASLPYCVFDRVTQSVTRDSASKFEDVWMQFNLYRDTKEANYSVKLNDDEDNLINLFDDADISKTLNISGYKLTNIKRQPTKELGVTDGVIGVSVQFIIQIQR